MLLHLFPPWKRRISSFPPHPGLWMLNGVTFETPGTGQILGWPELWGEIEMSKIHPMDLCLYCQAHFLLLALTAPNPCLPVTGDPGFTQCIPSALLQGAPSCVTPSQAPTNRLEMCSSCRLCTSGNVFMDIMHVKHLPPPGCLSCEGPW